MIESATEQGIKVTCEVCNEFEGTINEVRGHKWHCQQKRDAAIAAANGPEPLGPAVEPPTPEPEPEVEARERPAQDRTERVPLGLPQRRIEVPDNDGFNYHRMNDNWRLRPDRIKDAIKGGYVPVEDKEHGTVGSNDDGSVIKGVLMKIPKAWFDEDQTVKAKVNDRVDKAIEEGTVEHKEGDNRYIPGGADGIKITTSHREPGQ